MPCRSRQKRYGAGDRSDDDATSHFGRWLAPCRVGVSGKAQPPANCMDAMFLARRLHSWAWRRGAWDCFDRDALLNSAGGYALPLTSKKTRRVGLL